MRKAACKAVYPGSIPGVASSKIACFSGFLAPMPLTNESCAAFESWQKSWQTVSGLFAPRGLKEG